MSLHIGCKVQRCSTTVGGLHCIFVPWALSPPPASCRRTGKTPCDPSAVSMHTCRCTCPYTCLYICRDTSRCASRQGSLYTCPNMCADKCPRTCPHKCPYACPHTCPILTDTYAYSSYTPYSPEPSRQPYSPEPSRQPYSPDPSRQPYSPEPSRQPYSPEPSWRPVFLRNFFTDQNYLSTETGESFLVLFADLDDFVLWPLVAEAEKILLR